MTYEGEFQGNLFIDGEVDGEGVYAFLTEDTLVLSKAGDHFREKKVYLSPFNKFMLLTQNPVDIAEAFFYEIRGTNVGSIAVGPLGHPGDGEFDLRPMTSFQLNVKYMCDGIEVKIAGETGVGTSGFDNDKPLDPWRFSAQFWIPKDQLQAFFRLDDFVKDNLFRVFDEVFGTG
jgi:hypothetical protein